MIRDRFSSPSPFIACYVDADNAPKLISQAWNASETPSESPVEQPSVLADNYTFVADRVDSVMIPRFQLYRQVLVAQLQFVINDLIHYDVQIPRISEKVQKCNQVKLSLLEIIQTVIRLQAQHLLVPRSGSGPSKKQAVTIESNLIDSIANIQEQLDKCMDALSTIERKKMTLLLKKKKILGEIEATDFVLEKLRKQSSDLHSASLR